MTVVLSTSSPRASVALFRNGSLVYAEEREAPGAASGACLEMLDKGLAEAGESLERVRLFVADVGPGSFTGVKVGVVLCKILAYAVGARVSGLSSFDLVDSNGPVAIPSRKGEWFLRRLGQEPQRIASPEAPAEVGFGPGIEGPSYPEARRAVGLIQALAPMAPEALLPQYLAEPGISAPKRPYRMEPGP